MAHKWTYTFADLVTNTLLGDVPLSGVNFTEQLKPPGSCTASLKLSAPSVKKVLRNLGGDIGGLLQTGRTALYIDLDGTLVWGGILWTLQMDAASNGPSSSPTQVAQLGFMDFWSYFSQRLITWASAVYASVDQFTIVEDLVNTAQNQEGGNIGLIVPTVTCGVPFTISWDPSQLITVATAVDTVATQAGTAGFDYGVGLDYDSGGLPRKTLILNYPRSGRLAGTVGGPQIDTGGKGSLGYKVARDSTQQAISVWGIGSGSGPGSGVRSAQEYRSQLNAGWPLLETVMQHSDVQNQPILQSLTRTYLAARALPPEILTATLSLDCPLTPYGSYQVGDDARVLIAPDDFYVTKVDETQRITAVTVTPGDEGIGTVAVTLQAPPVEGGGAAPPVRTYPASLPAGVTLAHTYNGTTNTYNLGSYSRWITARNSGGSGGAFARVNIIGDGAEYGSFNTPPWTVSPPAQFRTRLVNAFGNGGTGIQLFTPPPINTPDSRVALSTGWAATTTGPVGAGMTATGTADFFLTPGTPFDNYTFWYYGTPGGGTFTYQVSDFTTGVFYSIVTISTNRTAGWYAESNVNLDPASTASVVVNVTSGPVTFGAWEASHGTSGFRVGRVAAPSVSANATTGHEPPTFNLPGGVADLAVIHLGEVDYRNQSTTFQADLTSLVASAQSAGSDVLLVVNQPDLVLLGIPQSTYAKAIYTVADAKNCAVLDLYDRVGWYPGDISDPSLYADGIVNPSTWGATDIANAIYTAVT